MNINAKTLKLMRDRVGLDQHDLSRAARIPRWRLAFFETGRCTLTTDERTKIVTAILKQAQRNVAWLQEQFE